MLVARLDSVALAVGQPTSLIGRFAYWCLADEYHNVAERVADDRLAQNARRAAQRYEEAAPRREEFEPGGFQRGQTVWASLRAYGSCSTVVR